eukprot:scaffold121984_cov72-Phaeocystis_antarctica.AAC.3
MHQLVQEEQEALQEEQDCKKIVGCSLHHTEALNAVALVTFETVSCRVFPVCRTHESCERGLCSLTLGCHPSLRGLATTRCRPALLTRAAAPCSSLGCPPRRDSVARPQACQPRAGGAPWGMASGWRSRPRPLCPCPHRCCAPQPDGRAPAAGALPSQWPRLRRTAASRTGAQKPARSPCNPASVALAGSSPETCRWA